MTDKTIEAICTGTGGLLSIGLKAMGYLTIGWFGEYVVAGIEATITGMFGAVGAWIITRLLNKYFKKK